MRTRIKNIPGLKQLQALLLSKWIDNSEFTAAINGGPAKGLVFPVQMPQDKLMWIGTWELDFAKALAENVQPGWVCYDIGGYKGYYAGIMALAGAREVLVFEPMPLNIEKIKQLINLNRSLPITLKKYAVCDVSGTSLFKIMPEETMGKLEQSSFQSNDKAINELSVDCITLDDLIKQGTSEPDFIKIDVEGAEEFALKGAIELIKRKRPLLMIEVHSSDIGKRCLNILESFYTNIVVLETGKHPEKGTPEICHYIVSN
jgi:FkbM family methyltransferase